MTLKLHYVPAIPSSMGFGLPVTVHNGTLAGLPGYSGTQSSACNIGLMSWHCYTDVSSATLVNVRHDLLSSRLAKCGKYWEFPWNTGNGYCNDPKFSDTQNICCNHSKVWTMWLYHTLMSPNDADGMANSIDHDQTAPLGAVWSGSALFAQAYLSENLGSLR